MAPSHRPTAYMTESPTSMHDNPSPSSSFPVSVPGYIRTASDQCAESIARSKNRVFSATGNYVPAYSFVRWKTGTLRGHGLKGQKQSWLTLTKRVRSVDQPLGNS